MSKIKCETGKYEPRNYDEAIEEWAWIWMAKRNLIASPQLLFALKERLRHLFPEKDWVVKKWEPYKVQKR